MKKFIAITTILTAATILGACGNQAPDTKAAQATVTSAIKANDFAQALGANKAVLAIDGKAKDRTSQLELMAKAQAAVAANDLTEAQDQWQAAIDNNGDAALTKTAKAQLAKVKATLKQLAGFEADLAAAQDAQAAGNTVEAAKLVDELLNQAKISRPAFADVYVDALQLQATLAKGQAAAKPEADSESSAASSNTSASDDDSDNPAANSPENQPGTSDKDITAADLDQARADIKALGENPNYFSPADLSRAITKMRAAGRDHLTQADWQ